RLLLLARVLDDERGHGLYLLGPGPRGLLAHVDVLDLDLRGQGLVLGQTVAGALRAPGLAVRHAEVGHLDLLLQAGDELLRLLGPAVLAVLREVDAHGIAVGDPVHRDQYPEHGEAQHERVAAVAQLPTPDGPDHVVPAQDDVGHD